MRRFGRTWCWRAAAVLSAMVAVLGITIYDVPGLIDGASASEDPYWLLLGSFASDVIALVAAYGAWRRQVWGVVLLIGVNLYWVLQSITTLFDPVDDGDVAFSLVMLGVHLVTLWCCLAPRGAALDTSGPRANDVVTG